MTENTRRETPDVAELRRLAESGLLIHPDAVLGLLDRLAHMTEARDNARAEVERLSAMLEGRCLSDITHRDEEHRQSFCMLPAEHAPLAHDDCMGCTWTDADHWQPSAVDRLAEQVEAVRALHYGEYVEDEDRNRCFECGDDHPCPTARALDGADS